jgi:predicted Zn-dependent protease
VLLDNHGGRNLDSVRTGLVDLLYGREPAPPAVPVSRMMLDEIASNGVDAALTRYRELVATDASGWRVDEAELNLVGYALLAQGDADGAVTVFEANVEAYPESFNVYDSLAEALAAAGETEEAIRNYARSLELNPDNTNAIRMLQRLADVGAD